MANLRKEARGRECQVRIYGVCNGNPETTVLAHYRMIEQNEPFVYDKRVLWKKVGRIRKNVGFKLRVITKSPVTLSGCQIRIE